MPSRFLVALACDAPGEVKERTLGEALRTGGMDAVTLGARKAGLSAAFGRFIAQRGFPLDGDTRRAVAMGLLAEGQTQHCLVLLRDLARESGAAALAVKGGALILAGLYGGERQLVDIDLLIAGCDLAAWRDAAARVGATFEPCLEAHELGYVRRGAALVELHGGLPAAVGKDSGPDFEAVRNVAAEPAPGYFGVRPVLGRAAREIAVHHFVYHHGGEPAYAFRALQDLARLGNDGAGICWGAHPPDAALGLLSGIVDSVRHGEFGDKVAEFLRRFGAVQDLQTSKETGFADMIDRWLALRKQQGDGRLAFVLGRVFPPGRPVRDRLTRPFSLAARYLSGAVRRSRPAAREIQEWRRFLDGA